MRKENNSNARCFIMKEYKNTNLKIYDYMKKDNEQTESIALNYFGRQISYSELIEVVEKLAVSFKKIGIKKTENKGWVYCEN